MNRHRHGWKKLDVLWRRSSDLEIAECRCGAVRVKHGRQRVIAYPASCGTESIGDPAIYVMEARRYL